MAWVTRGRGRPPAGASVPTGDARVVVGALWCPVDACLSDPLALHWPRCRTNGPTPSCDTPRWPALRCILPMLGRLLDEQKICTRWLACRAVPRRRYLSDWLPCMLILESRLLAISMRLCVHWLSVRLSVYLSLRVRMHVCFFYIHVWCVRVRVLHVLFCCCVLPPPLLCRLLKNKAWYI